MLTKEKLEELREAIDRVAKDNVDRDVVFTECLEKWEENIRLGETLHCELRGQFTRTGEPFIFG